MKPTASARARVLQRPSRHEEINAVDIVVVYALIARGGELREPRHRY